MKGKSFFKGLVLAAGLTFGSFGLNSCGTETPKPVISEITVRSDYSGGHFEGDNMYLSYNGKNVAVCDVEIKNDVKTVTISDLKPLETVTLRYGGDRGQFYAGENDISVICDGIVAAEGTVNLEDAQINYTTVGSDPSDKNLITAWTPEGIGKGSLDFFVSITTNIDPNRISSYSITFTPSDDTKQIVEDTFSETTLPSFYDTVKPDLSSKVYNSNSANISYPLPGGLADLTLEVSTVDGKKLSRIERLVLRAVSPDGGRVLRLSYPDIAADGTYTIVDNSGPDTDPNAGAVTYRIIAYTAAEDPSTVSFRATNLDNGEYLDDAGNFSVGNPLVGASTDNYFNGTPNSMNVKYEAVYPDGNNPSVKYLVKVESTSP